MDGSLLAVRLVLALMFAVAALAKLTDRQGTRQAVGAFGVPQPLVPYVSTLLAPVELVTAILILPSATAAVGAALALALLAAFTAAIVGSMMRGQAPDCHCFGQLHSSPAGAKTLARNLALAAASGFVLVGGPGSSLTGWVGRLSSDGLVAVLAGAAVTALVGSGIWLALVLLRRHGELLLRIEALERALSAHGLTLPALDSPPAQPDGLPVGSPAPEIDAHDLEGTPASLRSLTSEGPDVVLLFTDPGCGPCSALMPQVAAWQQEHGDALRIVILSGGSVEANLAHAREHGLADVLVQHGSEVSERYLVPGTPSAVLISSEQTIASPVHAGAEAIKSFIASRSALAVHHYTPQQRRKAPNPILQTLEGEARALSSVLAGTTVVLFWNPDCGFCERMLPELQRFDAAPPAGAPNLVVVSTGDPARNRAMGLSASVLLDNSFAAGSALGASGTPSAVLLDPDGDIASAPAVGAPAVLELLGAQAHPVAAS